MSLLPVDAVGFEVDTERDFAMSVKYSIIGNNVTSRSALVGSDYDQVFGIDRQVWGGYMFRQPSFSNVETKFSFGYGIPLNGVQEFGYESSTNLMSLYNYSTHVRQSSDAQTFNGSIVWAAGKRYYFGGLNSKNTQFAIHHIFVKYRTFQNVNFGDSLTVDNADLVIDFPSAPRVYKGSSVIHASPYGTAVYDDYTELPALYDPMSIYDWVIEIDNLKIGAYRSPIKQQHSTATVQRTWAGSAIKQNEQKEEAVFTIFGDESILDAIFQNNILYLKNQAKFGLWGGSNGWGDGSIRAFKVNFVTAKMQTNEQYTIEVSGEFQ
jgi:hypothetical protein